MKNYLSFCLILLTLISCAQSPNTNSIYKNEEGRFQVVFPDKPESNIQKIESQYGPVELFNFKSSPQNDDNKSYEVTYYDYPAGFGDSLSIEQIYSLFNDSQTTNFNSPKIQLVGTFNHKESGYLGREYRWHDTEGKTFSRIRFFLVKDRLYLLAVNTEEAKNFNVGINEFFDSFELINTEPNPNVDLSSENTIKRYEVDFPGPVETREMESPTEYGNAKIAAELYQPKNNGDLNLVYMITVLEYPEDITELEDFTLEGYYSGVIQNALTGRQSKLISRTDITQNGLAGIEVKESFRGGQIIITQRTFLDGQFQYAVQVMTTPGNDKNKAMNKFFDSFNINPQN